MATEAVVFWQPRPCWGLPNPSPFCMKLETWLRMAGLPYEAKSLTGPPKSPSGKMPYVVRADGSYLWDSTLIIETLAREHGVDLDQGLSEDQRALSTLLQRTFEEELYFLTLHDRWADERGWAVTSEAYFGTLSWPLRTFVVPMIRRQVLAAGRGQGVLRLPEGQRERKARADIAAIATILGEQPYFLGRPSTIDATAHALLANILWSPIESPLADAAREHPNLVAYCDRMRETYYADWTAG